jgi:hypothetical protein
MLQLLLLAGGEGGRGSFVMIWAADNIDWVMRTLQN